jgi:hypothetical protein
LSSLSSTIRTVFAIPPLQSETKKPTREMSKTHRNTPKMRLTAKPQFARKFALSR